MLIHPIFANNTTIKPKHEDEEKQISSTKFTLAPDLIIGVINSSGQRVNRNRNTDRERERFQMQSGQTSHVLLELVVSLEMNCIRIGYQPVAMRFVSNPLSALPYSARSFSTIQKRLQ